MAANVVRKAIAQHTEVVRKLDSPEVEAGAQEAHELVQRVHRVLVGVVAQLENVDVRHGDVGRVLQHHAVEGEPD